jgi:hypothetical protein
MKLSFAARALYKLILRGARTGDCNLHPKDRGEKMFGLLVSNESGWIALARIVIFVGRIGQFLAAAGNVAGPAGILAAGLLIVMIIMFIGGVFTR